MVSLQMITGGLVTDQFVSLGCTFQRVFAWLFRAVSAMRHCRLWLG